MARGFISARPNASAPMKFAFLPHISPSHSDSCEGGAAQTICFERIVAASLSRLATGLVEVWMSLRRMQGRDRRNILSQRLSRSGRNGPRRAKWQRCIRANDEAVASARSAGSTRAIPGHNFLIGKIARGERVSLDFMNRPPRQWPFEAELAGGLAAHCAPVGNREFAPRSATKTRHKTSAMAFASPLRKRLAGFGVGVYRMSPLSAVSTDT